MDKEEYINRIEDIQKEIKVKELTLSNLVQQFKREHSFMERDKVKLTRLNPDTNKEEEYYLFIKTVYFHPKLLEFQYRFSYITSLGKMSNAECGIHHRLTDKIEKVC